MDVLKWAVGAVLLILLPFVLFAVVYLFSKAWHRAKYDSMRQSFSDPPPDQGDPHG